MPYASAMTDAPRALAIEGGMVDCTTGEVRGQRPGRLTPIERRLLRFLVARPREPVSRDVLLKRVWGYSEGSSSRTLYATMRRLRQKIERAPDKPRHLVTIGGSGYAFVPLEASDAPAETLRGWRWHPPLDDFVGRRAPLARLRAWCLQGTDLVMELVGPPGIGKSRLALELAARQSQPDAGLPGGVVVMDASGVTRGADLLAGLARSLGLPIPLDERLPHRLRRVLTGRGPALLVIDGAEEVSVLQQTVEALAGPPLRVLLVTRDPVGAGGVLRLGPLGRDGDPSEGSTLLVARIRARWPRWTPSAADTAAIARIVDHFDGSPLGIELAAHAATVLTPAALVERLPEAVHAQLEDGIRWSWERLAEEDRATLSSLALFPVDFDVDAAEAVCEQPHVASALARLTDRALLQLLDGPQGRRLRLPGAVRSFVSEACPPSAEAAERLVTHFGRMGSDESLEALMRHGGGPRYRQLQLELSSLELAHRRDAGLRGAHAARAAVAALLFEGWSARALAILEERLALVTPESPVDLVVWFHRIRGEALRQLGRLPEARAALQQALALARSDAPRRVGSVLHVIGTLEQAHGTAEAAEEAFREALAEHEACGDAFRLALSRGELASARLTSGRIDEAIELFKDALALFRSYEAGFAEAVAMGNLGVAELMAGQFDAAEGTLQAALQLSRDLGSHRFELGNLANLGLLYATLGQLDEAEAQYRGTIERSRDVGDEYETCSARLGLAVVVLRQERLAEARQLLDGVEEGVRELAMPALQAGMRLARCSLCRREGDLGRAEARLREALEGTQGGPAAELRAWWEAEAGLIALARARRDDAVAHLQRARAVIGEGALTAEQGRHALQELGARLDFESLEG
ncbi:MAG: tetratricopeptide repeat protein [Myxococcales bacterium]|nr:tetratricopeptide repeat protein [Myxococcales bacterium]